MLKTILGIFIAILGLYFFTDIVFAQSDQEIAKKYGITFPIVELGNCNGVSSCKAFCDDVQNHQSCADFAKKHNLSDSSSKKSSTKSDEEILKLAKVELGCNSYDECMQFCEQENNMDKCMDFAARHNLGGNATHMKEQMSTIKSLLGCNSMKSCMDFCSNSQNAQKCADVFKKAGFDTGEENYSNEPPQVWCPKISSECKWDGAQCVCNGPQTCSKSPGCNWNGNICSCGETSFKEESGEVWCPKAGPNCKWDGNQCSCYDPGECNKYPGCTWTGTTCSCQGETSIQEQGDPVAECAKYGCTFDGKTCQCPSSSSTLDTVDFSSQCLSQAGCTWDASSKICSCPTTENQQSSQKEIEKQACETDKVCYWNGEFCYCPQSVQGAKTTRGLLLQILDFILRR